MTCSICGGMYAKFYCNLERFHSNGDRQAWLEKISVYLCRQCKSKMETFVIKKREYVENGHVVMSGQLFKEIGIEFNNNMNNIAWSVFSRMAEML